MTLYSLLPHPRNFIAAVAVMAGLLPIIGWLGGSFWFFDLFNHFQFQYAGFLAICVIVLLGMRTFRHAALAALFLIVPLVRLVPCYLPADKASTPPSMVRVASFNVLTSNPDHAATIRWTEETMPDVIFFTEVDKEWSESLKELEGVYPHWINEGPDFAFFSKFPIVSHEVHRIRDIKFPLLEARLNTPGGPLAFLAGHPPPPYSPQRAKEMYDFIAALAQEVSQESGPVIVAGDFNSSRWSWSARPLANQGLMDTAKGKAPGATWRRGNPLLGIPIDRILFRGKGTSCKSFMIGPDLGSDHRPVLAEINW